MIGRAPLPDPPTTIMRRRSSVIALACALAFAACSSDGVAPGAGSGEAPAPEAGSSAWERQLEAALAEPGDALSAATASALAVRPLEPVLLAEAEVVDLQRRMFLATVYDELEFQPVFVTQDGLTDAGARIVDTILAAEAHALEPSDYLPDEALAWIERLDELAHARNLLTAPTPQQAEIDALLEHASDPAVRAADAPAAVLIREHAEGTLRAAYDARLELERATRGAAAIVDALLADGLLAYAFDQRHFNPHYLDIENPTDEEKHAAIAERMRATFRAAAAAESGDAMQVLLDALPPSHPQYTGLLAERARYAAIVENGGWETIEPRSLRRGSSGARVRQLRQRLAIEGYFEGDTESDVFDAELQEAVRHYQQTHQMDVTGESSRMFWGSLNVTAERRLEQIELTLQRWRENRIGDDPRYLWVNIPDMHAEAWKDGNRDMRFRIVVGNTTRECNRRTGQMEYVNATPVQSAELSYVVLNPTWSVPIRIAREELLPELLENPNYFEEQGFEHIVNENGTEIIRQSPGPNNPLGKVKFMFPNIHNTYMHDTSRPMYFQFPIRAFSHGCMRVSEPDALLEYVLREDGRWDEDQVAEIFESQEETTIVLREHVPVHIEYYVVTVDDDGFANFLADIYRLDRDRLSPPDPEDLQCDPEPTPDHRLVLVEGELMIEDLDGVQYTREEWEQLQNGGGLGAGSGEGSGSGVMDELGVPASVTEGDYGP